MRRSATKAEVEAAGKLWAQRRAEPRPVPVSVVEPAPMRRVLMRCPGCSAWIPETLPEKRHAPHWESRDGAPVLVDCAGNEVAP